MCRRARMQLRAAGLSPTRNGDKVAHVLAAATTTTLRSTSLQRTQGTYTGDSAALTTELIRLLVEVEDTKNNINILDLYYMCAIETLQINRSNF